MSLLVSIFWERRNGGRLVDPGIVESFEFYRVDRLDRGVFTCLQAGSIIPSLCVSREKEGAKVDA